MLYANRLWVVDGIVTYFLVQCAEVMLLVCELRAAVHLDLWVGDTTS